MNKEKVTERWNKIADLLTDGNKSELARQAEMAPQTLNNYMAGNRMAGSEVLHRFCDLGININWLLTGEGQPLIKDIKKINLRELSEDMIDVEAQIQIKIKS